MTFDSLFDKKFSKKSVDSQDRFRYFILSRLKKIKKKRKTDLSLWFLVKGLEHVKNELLREIWVNFYWVSLK